MNLKPLLKHFSEIHHLPRTEQEALLQRAYEQGFGADQKLTIWKSNLVSGGVITAIILLLITVIGPLLRMPPALIASLVIVVVLPAFLIAQHRRFIRRLREELQKLLAA